MRASRLASAALPLPLLLLPLLLLLLLHRHVASADSLRRTPPMGWNTWCTNSTCGHDVCTEDEIKSVAQSMLDSSLAALGWTFIDVSLCKLPTKARMRHAERGRRLCD